jgi:Sulfotransferase family
MPMNILHLALIAAALPGSRPIHCRRDPMDACLSMYTHHFRGNYPFAYDLENLGFYWRVYDDLMAHWRSVLPVSILEVNYETLVEHPEATMRGVLEFCGLPWDPQCLAFHANGRIVRTSSFAQVRQPLYRSAVGGWRRFETELEPLRRALAGAIGGDGQAQIGGAAPRDRDRGWAEIAAAHGQAALGEHGAEEAFAAADLMDLPGTAAAGQVGERGEEPVDQAAHDRVARGVLGVVIAGGDDLIGGQWNGHKVGISGRRAAR